MKTVMSKGLFLLLIFFSYQISAQRSYAPDESLRSAIRAEVWKDLKSRTPKQQQAFMGLLFYNNAIFMEYEKIVKRKGYPTYDLATVQLFFTDLCKEIARGREFTDAETDAHYETMKAKYDASKIDAELSNIEKQRKYDPLILKAIWVAGLYELNQKGAEAQELAKQMLNGNEKPSSNIDFEQTPRRTGNQEKNNSDKIVDVIMRTVTSFGLGGTYVTNKVYVLYENGDLFTDPSEPLETLDIERSKRQDPKKWNTYTKKGNLIYMTNSRTAKVYDWKKWFDVRPASTNFRISGKFNTSDPFGGGQIINASAVYFDRQGRFAWKTVKGGNTDWKPIYSKSNTAGTYDIINHTITLTYNKGTTESFFFGLYPKDDEHFVIGSSHFVPVRK